MTNSLVPTMADKEYIEKMAHQLSQFDEDNFDDDNDNYVGRVRSKLTQGVLLLGVKNNSTSAREFYIYSGYLIDSMNFSSQFGAGAGVSGYGQVVDGDFKPIGGSATDLEGFTDPGMSINDWLAYIKNTKGNKITKIVVRSSNPAVHSQKFTITKKDPLNQLADRTIRLSTWRNPMQQDLGVTIINETIDLGLQDFVKFSIPPSVTDLVIELHMNGYAS